MKDLETCRKEIDDIDQQIMSLFEKRMNVAKDVVLYKIEKDLPIFQPEREQQVIKKNINRLTQEDLKSYAEIYMQNMMNVSKTYQASFINTQHSFDLKKPCLEGITVGFQGVPGSFSEHALESYFGKDAKRKNYVHFKDVYQALKDGEIHYGVVPLENSSTGAINDNYDLIRDYGFFIVGEQKISIAQHLLGIKGTKVEDLTDVYSHPQGIQQCKEFLSEHRYIQPHEYLNTAVAAKYVADEKNPHLSAIASSKAAQLYGLDIIEKNIQDNKNNSTRFIIFGKDMEKIQNANCISIVFTLPHKAGALFQVMKIINDHFINLLKIESRPIKDSPWEYYFYVDFEGSLDSQNIVSAIDEIKAHTHSLRIIGNYMKK